VTVTDTDPPLDPDAGSVERAHPAVLDDDAWEAPVTVRRIAIETLIAVGLGLVAAIAVTWPLVTKLGHTGHDAFDPRFQAWTIDWVQHKLGSPGSLFDANIFAPEPRTLAYSDSLLGIAIPMLPFRWLGMSPIGQLNVALLLSFATTFASGYLFGRVVTRSIVVGALTAVAFAFGPFGSVSSGVIHAAAHAGVAVAATAAWWLADSARARRPLFAPSALLVAALVWQASVSFYPGAYAFGAAAVVLVVRWRSLGRRGWLWAVGALAVAGACALVLAIPYLQVRDDQPGFKRTLADLPPLAADFGATDPRLSIWGSLLGTGGGWPIYGEPAFPGVFLLVLAPIGAIAGWRARARLRLATIAALALVLVGLALGLGAGPTGWRRYAPYRLLFEYVPGWEALRATGRAWVVGLLGVGVLAGIGVLASGRWLATRLHGRARTVIGVLAAVAVVGVLVEGYAPWTAADRGTVDVAVSPVDHRLADLPPGGVLYLPALEQGAGAVREAFSGFRQAENVYGTTAHHRITPNGYSGYFPPSWKQLSREMEALPDAATLRRLRALGVRYVVVRDWASGTVWAPLLDPVNAAPLRHVGTFDGDVLYEVPSGRSG
jgi:hypothetical protein